MLPSAEEWGDPTDELPMTMMMMLVVMDEMMFLVTYDTLLSPLKTILSIRDLFPLFENAVLQRNSTDSLSIRACSYIRLSMSCEYTPVLTLVLLHFYLIIAEPDTPDIGGFFVDLDE